MPRDLSAFLKSLQSSNKSSSNVLQSSGRIELARDVDRSRERDGTLEPKLEETLAQSLLRPQPYFNTIIIKTEYRKLVWAKCSGYKGVPGTPNMLAGRICDAGWRSIDDGVALIEFFNIFGVNFHANCWGVTILRLVIVT